MISNNQDDCTDLTLGNGWEELKTFFGTPRNVLIVSHKNPDGDAVGSALGLALILKQYGHRVIVAVPDDSPGFIRWLPGHKEVLVLNKKSGKRIPEVIGESEVLFFVDFNTTDRLGALEPLIEGFGGLRILIDHHPPGRDFTHFKLVNTEKGSASELVFDWIQQMGYNGNLNADVATCLLAGIMTDTVGFRVGSSYPGIFITVAALMACGADKDRINEEVYNNFSVGRMKLLGFSLLEKMIILPEYQTAFIALTRAEMNRFEHRKGDTEGFVNYPLSMNGVHFSVLFTEQEDEIKLSLRSKGHFPANQFAARYFNGGGHLNASGGRFTGTLEEAVRYFTESIGEFFSQENPT
ncbi:MAG: bifunctional oligoribonuclease/PAP phosphatase NrnA [Bacteroidales bacterium]